MYCKVKGVAVQFGKLICEQNILMKIRLLTKQADSKQNRQMEILTNQADSKRYSKTGIYSLTKRADFSHYWNIFRASWTHMNRKKCLNWTKLILRESHVLESYGEGHMILEFNLISQGCY